MKRGEIVDWEAVEAHAAAYAGYPEVQDSINFHRDTGGVATVVMTNTVEAMVA